MNGMSDLKPEFQLEAELLRLTESRSMLAAPLKQGVNEIGQRSRSSYVSRLDSCLRSLRYLLLKIRAYPVLSVVKNFVPIVHLSGHKFVSLPSDVTLATF